VYAEAMARAIRVHECGGPDVLRLDDVEVGDPGPGQARVRHTAIGVNYVDTYHRSGLYPLPSLPSAIGVEAAGVVEAVGPDVTDVAVGQRVSYASAGVGSYATVRLVSSSALVPLPEQISNEVAASVLLKGMTVEYLVCRTYAVKPGQTVLLHAAAGGVGLIACQWLAHLGATVIGTVGSDEKAELVLAHGCEHPVVYTRESFVDRVREVTDGAGVPVVYDSVGKATFEGSLDCLAPRGMLVTFGNASGKPPAFDSALLGQKGSLFLTRPSLFHYVATREELLASARQVFGVVASGVVRTEVRQRWLLAEAKVEHEALESRATTGASILIP
jgi:NADPH2:quinone reductase